MLILNTEHWQTTHFPDAALKVVAMVAKDSVEIVKDHCHFHNPADIEKRKFRKTFKDRAAVFDVTPRQTFFSAQRDLNRDTAYPFFS